MTTTSTPCVFGACDGTVTVRTDDRGTLASCDTCAFVQATWNRGTLDLGIIRDPVLSDAHNDIAILHEERLPLTPIEDWVLRATRAEMRHLAILQEINTVEHWAAADDVGVQALHVVATHIDDGYGLASSTRREQPGG